MKRLIEVDFPMSEVSKQSAREKSIRHGHISTLHIWWARRPLAACRAAIYASLVPAPDAAGELRKELDMVGKLSDWDNSLNERILREARKTILAANGGNMPRVLDCFAGGGSIPLESLRLGCETEVLEYNPVAVLILKATLEYPQRYGQKLIQDIRKWGDWVLEVAKKEIGDFYPAAAEQEQETFRADGIRGGRAPVGYLWARTLICRNPSCGIEIPLMRQSWLRKTEDSAGNVIWDDSIYLRPSTTNKGRLDFQVTKGKASDSYDPSKGTRPTAKSRSSFVCPLCGTTYKQKDLQEYANTIGFGHRMLAVVATEPNGQGRRYLLPTDSETRVFEKASGCLEQRVNQTNNEFSSVPDEPLPYLRSIFNVHVYGIHSWNRLFNPRQLLSILTFTEYVKKAHAAMVEQGYDEEYAKAVCTYLAFCVDRIADYNSALCVWAATGEFIAHTFGRQALGMVWDYFELNPFSSATGNWKSAQAWILAVVEHCSTITGSPSIHHGSATSLRYDNESIDAVIVDPPYYDYVPYADLSDFFYVWLKRSIGDTYPKLFATPLTPKSEEIVQLAERNKAKYSEKTKAWYQNMMATAFKEINRVLKPNGISTIVFAHKTTEAWETLVNALVRAGLVPTSSWPIHTERTARLRAKESAALASSFFLTCRKRIGSESAYFKDIKNDLERRIIERLGHFWNEGVRGSDFFISAIGPAVEVFGRYEKVKKLSGEEVTVAELMNEVRTMVTDYAIGKILQGAKLEKIDPITRFYVLWRWTYNSETIEYDDGRKLAQAVGIELDDIRGPGKLVSGKDKIAVLRPQDRNVENIGGKVPVNMVDALHKACLLWNADKTRHLKEFLNDSGYSDDPSFWETAQALSELLPDGDKEKQMLQGLIMKASSLEGTSQKQMTFFERWSK